MAVFDRELIINGEAVRSPEQQVYKNMKDIKALKEKIKEWYSCDTELNSADVSVARTNTNVPDEIDDGFLLDTVGNLFKITGGDEDNLLLAFYSSIRGTQGEPGTPGASSNDKGTYLTHVEPTLADDIYTLSTGNIDNFSTDSIPVQVNDIIVYIDSNDQPTSVYLVASISGTTLTLTKEGDYAKGKQLYQHNIHCQIDRSNFINVIIINDNNTAINTLELLVSYLKDNGFTSYNNWLLGSGYWSSQIAWGLFASGNLLAISSGYMYAGTNISPSTITDTIVAL